MTVAFVIGNGESRKDIDLYSLKQYGKVYACNAVYRHYQPDYLVAVDVKMILEINHHKWQMENEVWTNPNKQYHGFHNVSHYCSIFVVHHFIRVVNISHLLASIVSGDGFNNSQHS